MLEISDLSISFRKKEVLRGLDLELSAGEILGIVGKNGAGKTTLFECLYQTLKYSGEILWNSSALKRQDIGYLETENYFYPYITGKEYLAYFSGNQEKAKRLAEKFSLPLQKFVNEYSHGMKKKLALIGVLLLDKQILILDEPFNGVDFESVHLIYEIIAELRQEQKTVLISSHIIETILRTCDRVAILEEGKISKNFSKESFGALADFRF